MPNTDFLDNLDLLNITVANLPGLSADEPIILDEMEVDDDIGPDPNIVIKVEKDDEVETIRGPSPEPKVDPMWNPPPAPSPAPEPPKSPKSPEYQPMSPDTTTKFYENNATLHQAARKLEVSEDSLKELIQREVLNYDNFTEIEEYNVPLHAVRPERNILDPVIFMTMKSCDFCHAVNPIESHRQHIQTRCKSCKMIIPFDVLDIIHEHNELQVKEALQGFITEQVPKPRRAPRKPRRQRKTVQGKGTLERA